MSNPLFLLAKRGCFGLFNGNLLSVNELVIRAKNYDMELNAADVGCHKSAPLLVAIVRWQPPQQGFLKLNVDVAIDMKEGSRGVGCVVRDSLGCLVGVMSMQAPIRVSVLATELYAMKIGLSFALDTAFVPLIVECDCLFVVQLVTFDVECLAVEGGLVNAI